MPRLRKQIAAATDDARRNNASYFDDNALELGDFAGASLGTALRFTGVTIPRGRRIRSAHVLFRGENAYAAATCNVRIKGEKAANPAMVTSAADWDGRAKTAAFANWNAVPAFAADVWASSPDITPILQEIVNQAAWAPGNAVNLFFENNGSSNSAIRKARAYNFSAEAAPVLAVNYAGAVGPTIVRLRDPHPPHAAVMDILPVDLSYGFGLMKMQTATFRISRGDPNLVEFGDLLHPDGPPPMFTIERPDGLMPWAGFLRRFKAARNDPFATFELADHTWRLSKAVTRRSGSFRGSSDRAIIDTLAEMNDRALPPLYIDLSRIRPGPAIGEYVYKAVAGDKFLKQMADFTGFEWGYDYAITQTGVVTSLLWAEQLGVDRRDSLVLEEDRHLANVSYDIDYDEGLAGALVVGGSGDFAGRPAAGAVKSSSIAAVPGVATVPLARKSLVGLGGMRVLIDQQLSDRDALAAAAARLLETPDHYAEGIEFSLVESDELDLAQINVGDVVTARLADTDLGMALERPVRILALQLNPNAGIHETVLQVVT